MVGRLDIENTKAIIDGDSDVVDIGMGNTTEVNIGTDVDMNNNPILNASTVNGVPLTDAGSGDNFLADDGTYKAGEVETFTVPTAVAVRDLVYVTGSLTADRADNSGIATGRAIGVVLSKPTSTSAVVKMVGGKISGYTGLTPGAPQFLGTLGGMIEGSLPTTPGSVIKKVGTALSATVFLFEPKQVVVM